MGPLTLTLKTHTTSRSFTYSYYCSGQSAGVDKPTLVLIHGWPDEALLFKKVVPHLRNLGHRLLVPDTLGYGGSSKPIDTEAYNSRSLANDLVEILDAEDIKSVIVIGHDWGSYIAQRLYLWHPERVVGLGMLNVAYMTPNQDQPFDLDEMLTLTEKYFGYPLFSYWKLFTAPDGPKIMDAHLDSLYDAIFGAEPDNMKKMFCVPDAMRNFLLADGRHPVKPFAQDSELRKRFVERLHRDGLQCPVQYYHAMVNNIQHEVEKEIPKDRLKIDVPVLFVGCTEDAVCRADSINAPRDAGLLPHLTVETLESAHHCLYEKPDELGSIIARWIKEKF